MTEEALIGTVLLRFIAYMSPIMLATLGIWWRVENRQDQKLETFRHMNNESHEVIRSEIQEGHNLLRKEISEVHKRVDHIISNTARLPPYRNGQT